MNTKPIRVMLLGLMILMLGGFAMADPSTDLLGFEFLLMLIGVGLGIYGYRMSE